MPEPEALLLWAYLVASPVEGAPWALGFFETLVFHALSQRSVFSQLEMFLPVRSNPPPQPEYSWR
jgi:hypothetical protein